MSVKKPENITSLGQKELKATVLDKGLCCGCGACLNLCPYFSSYKNQIILMAQCNLEVGRCYSFCPRTPTNFEKLQETLFNPCELNSALGPFKALYMTRSSNEEMRSKAQHGGTVTTLLQLALQEQLIDTAILTQEGDSSNPRSLAVTDPSAVVNFAGSKFAVSPIVETFNIIAKTQAKKIGVVCMPCQAQAFAKMKVKPFSENTSNIDKLKLTVGLFCGWAFFGESLSSLLEENCEGGSIHKLDIPPSKYHSMEAHTEKGIVNISLDDCLLCIRESCQNCGDMTAEFSDISVGAARLPEPEGWETAKSWNQVIVRSEMGQSLIDLARTKGLLEFREVPQENLARLEAAALKKKENSKTHG